ncbi:MULTISPECIES: hypothetical protein [Streptomyces]|uniref:Uncharacterized protein n=2 Tax=Streptomyces TaxID=1883 RepID=A0A0W7X5H8_9ACTN|nr:MULTISPECIES: hypothetical protein [Streptomyces]KUF18127.1 hypothetical protein AT728_21155 [Streptomyces silvensis]MVO90876.1 hypothetical protein [Streptomyces typhae]
MSATEPHAPELPKTTLLEPPHSRAARSAPSGPESPAQDAGAVRTCVPALPSATEPADRDDYVFEANIVRGLD